MTLKEDFETEKCIHIIQGPHVADILCKMEKLMGRVLLRSCNFSELQGPHL